MRGVWRIRQFLDKQRQRRRLRQASRAVARFPNVGSSRVHGLDAPLIVTLTSYPPRFPTLGKTLRSILDQTVRPDRTILWLTANDLASLPEEIHALQVHGLEIRTCSDLRSYKKLIPALAAFPDAWFVTADDDVYYPPDWLEGLVGQAERRTVVAARAHLAQLDASGRLLPYSSWVMNTGHLRTASSDTRLFPTGVGGVLYPPNAFAKEVLDEEAFMRLCPHGDDIWFFWMARLAGTGHARTPSGFEILAWPNSQDVGLFRENQFNSRNDLQIRNMEQEFGLIS
jgi:hypothetical protein